MFKKSLIYLMLLSVSPLTFGKVFEAVGEGDTPEMARRVAVSNAIKESVGEFVSAKEELNNDDFNQFLVSHSNAYVKKVDVISQKKINSDEYRVEVAVDIESQVLLKALKDSQKVRVKDIQNDELFADLAKLNANKETKQDFQEVFEETLLKPLQNGDKVLVDLAIDGKLRILDADSSEEYATVSLPITATPNKEFLQIFKRLLKQSLVNNTKATKVVELNLSKSLTYNRTDIESLNKQYIDNYKWITELSKYYGNNLSGSHKTGILLTLLDQDENELDSYFFKTSRDVINKNVKLEVRYQNDKPFNPQLLLPKCEGNIICQFASGKAKINLIFPIKKEIISEIKGLDLIFSHAGIQ